MCNCGGAENGLRMPGTANVKLNTNGMEILARSQQDQVLSKLAVPQTRRRKAGNMQMTVGDRVQQVH